MSKTTAILERYKGRKEDLIAILQDINAEYRYLPEFVLKYMARKLDVPYSQVYSIATFYTAFSLVPKGKYKISVCLGTACHVRGAQRIMESLERELDIKNGGTTKDMLFSLESVRCIGCCGLAPVFAINEELYGKVSQGKVPQIIEKYRKAEVKDKAYAKT
ncbi:MAG: NAD(P)H-dependent oxidoreductase subunit E [Elusimicrobia bacterium]|nr:NAD(P)H-dependent oxidoreductase subunit E [Elusimicrobiota bacterium]